MKKFKNILIIAIIFIIWTILSITSGYFYRDFFGEKEPPKIVYKDKIVEKIIYRKYTAMTPTEKNKELFHYDTNPFKLDIQPYELENTNFRITGEVYKRKAYRDVKIECGGSGNWKFYVGVTVAAAAITYGGYKLINR